MPFVIYISVRFPIFRRKFGTFLNKRHLRSKIYSLSVMNLTTEEFQEKCGNMKNDLDSNFIFLEKRNFKHLLTFFLHVRFQNSCKKKDMKKRSKMQKKRQKCKKGRKFMFNIKSHTKKDKGRGCILYLTIQILYSIIYSNIY